jgi:hypothetical protein
MLLPIPVKPFVRHLLIKHYGKEPIAVRANSDLGQIFLLAVVRKAYLNLTFNWVGDVPPRKFGDLLFDDAEDVIEIEMPANYVEIKFELNGKFNAGVIMPDMIEQLGRSLESYARIYMKAFSHGYRTLFNSSRNSALVFHELYEFDEDVLSRDNCEKIIQRENAEVKDPIDSMGTPRKSYRLRAKEK